jgi:hypothetical protein
LRPGDIDGMRRALERIRASPACGREVPFARVASAVFDEIESLRSERHTLIAICEALEAEGFLPDGSDSRSLSKALCRERKRRDSRSGRSMGVKKRATGVSPPEKTQSAAGPEIADAPDRVGQDSPEDYGSGMRLQPGNKFVIRPLDLEGLPEL